MPSIFFFSLLLGILIAVGAGHHCYSDPKPDAFDYACAVGSVILVVMLLANIDKFFKDYSTCFPI